MIIVSVLLALSADAWLQGHQDQARRAEHLASLAIDFAQMSERADSSIGVAERGMNAGSELLLALAERPLTLTPDSAAALIGFLSTYEVFSASTGAYESLVASGDLGLLGDIELSRQLATFFGSFEDLRVSETQLLVGLRDLAAPELADLVGWHLRLPYYGGRVSGFDELPVARWAESDAFLGAVGRIAILHQVTLEDYRFLRPPIDAITQRLNELQGGGP